MGNEQEQNSSTNFVLPGNRPPRGLGRMVPIGRHGRPREEIEKIQRQRILDAFVIVVGRMGVMKAHVSDVCAEAGVSTREFYSVFRNKNDCFVSAFDAGARIVFQGAQRAYEEAEGCWEDRLTAMLQFTFTLLAQNPAFARLCILETQHAGPAAREHLNGIVQRFRDTMGGKSAIHSPVDSMPDDAFESAIVGSAYKPIIDYVRDGKAERLPELVPLLTYALRLLAVGPERTTRLFARP